MAMLEIVNAPVPLLVSVAVKGALLVPTTWLPKLNDWVEKVVAGLVVPVPVKLTLWGLAGSESLMVTFADRVPLAVGVKVTLMAQFAPAAKLVPQVLV